MLLNNFIYATVAQITSGDVAIVVSVFVAIINLIALRQALIKNRREYEDRFITKERLDREVKAIETQLILMDKDACREREHNIREHDSIKKDIDSKLDSISRTVNKLFDLVTNKLK